FGIVGVIGAVLLVGIELDAQDGLGDPILHNTPEAAPNPEVQQGTRQEVRREKAELRGTMEEYQERVEDINNEVGLSDPIERSQKLAEVKSTMLPKFTDKHEDY